MHASVAEVAPVAAPAIEALPWLLALAGLFFAVGLIKLVHGFVHAMFGWSGGLLGHVPVVGKVAAKPFHKIEQHVTHWLGEAEQGLDHYIGLCFHNLAALVRMFAREIEGLAHDLWLVSAVIPTLVGRLGLNYLIRGIKAEIKAWLHLLRRVERLASARLHTVERIVINHVYPQARVQAAELDHVLTWDIPHLRARTKALEDEYARLQRWTHRHAKEIATLAFTGAVAIALRRLKWNWIGCKNWRRIGKHVCGLPTSLIEGLLAVALSFELLVDPEEIAQVALDVEGAFEGVFERIAS